MKHFIESFFCIIFAMCFLSSCSNNEEEILKTEDKETPIDAKNTPMTFSIAYPGTRVAGNAFEDGDSVGLFVANDTLPLEIGGNLVNNEALTLNGSNWAAGRTLYWDEGTYTAYAYYPYITTISSIEDQPFSVSTDQSTTGNADATGGFEASDLLYAKTMGVKASAEPVSLTFKHIMSKLRIRLIKGEDFEGDMPDDAEVIVHSTYTDATVDLSAGVATVNGRGNRAMIKAKPEGNHTYSAIIVPQRLENRMPLVEVEMKGVSYLVESKFQFKAGTEHTINLIIQDNPDQVKIEIGGEVQDWQ